MNTPKLYMLVGLPASGKSTYRRNNFYGVYCLSTDDMIEEYAKSLGKTYSDVFEEYIKTATEKFEHNMKIVSQKNVDVVIDRTNLTVSSRKKIIDVFPNHEKHAIVFMCESHDLHMFRLNSRKGKEIPKHIFDSMSKSYEEPSVKEGFHSVRLEIT